MDPAATEGRGKSAALRQFLLKVHGDCNLACDYCYVYEHADQSWRVRRGVMSPAVLAECARRIAEHTEARDIGRLRVVLHGGEPLLAGADFIDGAAYAIRRAVRPETEVDFRLQTNGTLLDDGFLEVFHRHRIGVGVSVDGNGSANDRHRRYANGRTSYDRVVRGLELLRRPENRSVYSGLLCTVDLANDPVETYESLLWSQPPMVDLLLPHGNWVTPPPGLAPGSGRTLYGDWLVAVFDRWYDAPRRETDIRLFDSAISLLLGGPGRSETIGADPVDLVVLETDGTIEQHDSLKTTVDGGAATGMSVLEHSFEDVLAHEAWGSPPMLSAACQRCPVVGVCGGGLRAHRFDGDGFDRPSAYCADLYALIGHIRTRLSRDLAALRAPTTAERCSIT